MGQILCLFECKTEHCKGNIYITFILLQLARRVGEKQTRLKHSDPNTPMYRYKFSRLNICCNTKVFLTIATLYFFGRSTNGSCSSCRCFTKIIGDKRRLAVLTLRSRVYSAITFLAQYQNQNKIETTKLVLCTSLTDMETEPLHRSKRQRSSRKILNFAPFTSVVQ